MTDEPVLDLHGLRVADAVRRTTAFVVGEQQRGTSVVRIITGHGTGAVKQAVRQVLTSHPAVAYLRPKLSSDAAVLVVLKPPPRKQEHVNVLDANKTGPYHAWTSCPRSDL